MTYTELKKGILELLQSKFPKNKYKYYSMAVVEKYDRPCFFVQLKPIDTRAENHNSRFHQMAVYITFFQKEIDEGKMLNTIQEIQDLFGLNVKIGEKSVNVMDFSWNYVGTDRNIPEIVIELQYLTQIERDTSAPLLERLVFEKEMEE